MVAALERERARVRAMRAQLCLLSAAGSAAGGALGRGEAEWEEEGVPWKEEGVPPVSLREVGGGCGARQPIAKQQGTPRGARIYSRRGEAEWEEGGVPAALLRETGGGGGARQHIAQQQGTAHGAQPHTGGGDAAFHTGGGLRAQPCTDGGGAALNTGGGLRAQLYSSGARRWRSDIGVDDDDEFSDVSHVSLVQG